MLATNRFSARARPVRVHGCRNIDLLIVCAHVNLELLLKKYMLATLQEYGRCTHTLPTTLGIQQLCVLRSTCFTP